jgi:hypothetical protein
MGFGIDVPLINHLPTAGDGRSVRFTSIMRLPNFFAVLSRKIAARTAPSTRAK